MDNLGSMLCWKEHEFRSRMFEVFVFLKKNKLFLRAVLGLQEN